ncbi:hypothetical protein CEXT_51441 [Caerostris extrusa]|uniref:Uncharacterized protein n=1 Tax=Caerostris extrusa TaxID=172846 RepID=A0AAV4N433_CAEEX|nr:hypothetical protein CEXT_51441 [Caerostris extrusa]
MGESSMDTWPSSALEQSSGHHKMTGAWSRAGAQTWKVTCPISNFFPLSLPLHPHLLLFGSDHPPYLASFSPVKRCYSEINSVISLN